MNVYGIFATNSCIFKMPINGFLTCLNTSRALKMQTIECGLFAPESLSVCVPFLAKVHPVLSSEQALLSKKLQPIFKSCLTSAKTPNSSPNKRGCDFYQMKVRSYELDFLCLLFFGTLPSLLFGLIHCVISDFFFTWEEEEVDISWLSTPAHQILHTKMQLCAAAVDALEHQI